MYLHIFWYCINYDILHEIYINYAVYLKYSLLEYKMLLMYAVSCFIQEKRLTWFLIFLDLFLAPLPVVN